MNVVYSVKLGEPTGSEPVSLSEAKAQLRVDTTADDTLITALISSARHQIEQFTCVSLVARSVDLVAKLDGSFLFELPYGPITNTPTVTELAMYGGTNEPITTFDSYGDFFIQIKPQVCGMYAVSYESGYTNLPGALKSAVLHQVAYLYEHRGDDEGIDQISPTARGLAKMYRRVVI